MATVSIGLAELGKTNWQALADGPVAALVHAASVLPDSLEHIVDALARSPVDLAAVLAPEHGFRGEHQAEHGDPPVHVDNATGVKVFSVYRRNASELGAIVQDTRARTILVDIQDAGTRLYTYVWTLFDLMSAVAQLSPPLRPRFVVADRPNPLGGERVEGPVLNVSCCSSRYGRLAVPHRHGLTIGELARLFAHALGERAPRLTVVPMRGWHRRLTYDQIINVPWIPPSPNLPTVQAALAYPVSVWLEATPNLTEGRGTSLPFSLVGAPGLNGSSLASRLNACDGEHAAAAAWRTAPFVPTWWKFEGSSCGGVQLVRPPASPSGSLFDAAVHLLLALRDELPARRLHWDGVWFGQPGHALVDRYAGTPRLREMLDDPSVVADDFHAAFAPEAAAFERSRQRFLLYD